MIELNDTSRIIGDYLEINADIVTFRFRSKYPRFIKKILVNQKYKKLLNSLEKFRKSDYILNVNNLYEFFIYIFNNYPPYGNYHSVDSITIKSIELGKKQIEAKVCFDRIIAWIAIEEEGVSFEINAKEISPNKEQTGINITLQKMESKSSSVNLLLQKINKQLIEDIYQYIFDIISSYKTSETKK